jgi:hypothetical protein
VLGQDPRGEARIARLRADRLRAAQPDGRAYPVGEPMDVIFCRNVLIYFDKPTQEAVVTRLCRLPAAGRLPVLGHSESIAGSICRSTGRQHRIRGDRWPPKIRVLVIDDSASVRQTMKAILEADPEIEVIAAAADPFAAARHPGARCPTSSRWTWKCRAWTASPSCAS